MEIRQERTMCSLFIPFCKAEYHGRHEKYHSQEAEHDSFCKDQTHVKTNAEFHEHQATKPAMVVRLLAKMELIAASTALP